MICTTPEMKATYPRLPPSLDTPGVNYVSGHTKPGFGTLLEEMANCVFDYLEPKDIYNVSLVDKGWHATCTCTHIWETLCRRRWGIKTAVSPLKHGARTWLGVYTLLASRQKIPLGPYTKKGLIWGSHRGQGVDAWLLLAHRPDCRTIVGHRETTGIPPNVPLIELQIVLQNAGHANAISIDLHNLYIMFKSGSTEPIVTASPKYAPKLVAKNGSRCTSSIEGNFKLNHFDYAVFSVFVRATGYTFESDFLESLHSIWVPIQSVGFCRDRRVLEWPVLPDNYRYGGIGIRVVDESIVWKHYKTFSGGFVTLVRP